VTIVNSLLPCSSVVFGQPAAAAAPVIMRQSSRSFRPWGRRAEVRQLRVKGQSVLTLIYNEHDGRPMVSASRSARKV